MTDLSMPSREILGADGKPVEQPNLEQVFSDIDRLVDIPGVKHIGATILSSLRLYGWGREMMAKIELPEDLAPETKDAYLSALMAEAFQSSGQLSPFDDEALLNTMQQVVIPFLLKDVETHRKEDKKQRDEYMASFKERIKQPVAESGIGLAEERGNTYIVTAGKNLYEDAWTVVNSVLSAHEGANAVWLSSDAQKVAATATNREANASVVAMPDSTEDLDANKVRSSLYKVIGDNPYDFVIADTTVFLGDTAEIMQKTAKRMKNKKQTMIYIVAGELADAIVILEEVTILPMPQNAAEEPTMQEEADAEMAAGAEDAHQATREAE